MGSKRTTRKRAVGRRKNQVGVSQIKLTAVSIIPFTISISLLALVLGWTFAGILAAPVYPIIFRVVSEWYRGHDKQRAVVWRELLRFPKLNYLNIFAVILTIFAVQFALGWLFFFVDDRMRPDVFYSGPGELFNDPRSLVVMLLAGVISYFAGGFIAGKLPNKKCPAPYRHAIAATVLWNLLNFSLFIPLLALGWEEDLPSREDIGYIILATCPSYLLSAFGTWFAVRKRVKTAFAESSITPSDKRAATLPGVNNRGTARQSRKKHGKQELVAESMSIEGESTTTPDLPSRKTFGTTIHWLRRRLVGISICIVLASLLVLGFSAFVRKYPKPVRCENAPSTATLNFWPVGYAPYMPCHENPPVDAQLVGSDHYSRSREEWERGLVAKKGDEIYVRIYINNGALNNAEQINPGRGIARNVRLRTAITPDSSGIHYVEVEFAGDNTNKVVSRFKITIGEHERIEVLPNSGEVSNAVSGEVISKDLDVGNNTILIGDLPPKFSASVDIRFRVRVVG